MITQSYAMVEKISIHDIKEDHMIYDSKYDPFGRRLATTNADGKVHLYDIDGTEKKSIAEVRAHDGPAWRICWANPKFGNYFATCGFDKLVKIWKEVSDYKGSFNKWEEDWVYNGHEASVNCVAFGPWELDFKLAACSSDGYISILTLNVGNGWEGQKTNTPHSGPINAVTWAPASNFDH